MKVVTAAQMREIDRVSIEQRGVSGLALMERAGEAVFDEIMDRFSPKRAAIVAGKGNNAGDGFVVARLLQERGVEVVVCLLSPGSELRGDALENFRRMPRAVERVDIESAASLGAILDRSFDCVVDAILGTGVKGKVTGLFGECIEAINRARAAGVPVVAVDVPSGLPADGGPLEGPAVRANVTVTLGLPKIGLVTGPSSAWIEDLVIADIGLPADLTGDPAIDIELTIADEVAHMLPSRPAHGHKGTFGSVLVIAGSRGMSGAAVLTAEGAQRSGAGLVYTACPRNLEPTLERHLVEPLQVPVASDDGWRFDLQSQQALLAFADKVDAVALGPGLGTHEATRSLVGELTRRIAKPLVIDADGLNCLVQTPEALIQRTAPTVVTPHPGEMARLLGLTTAAVQADRLSRARQAAQFFRCVAVLKGAGTVVASPQALACINSTGNNGMAKGGSGDVLTGLIAGLLAQGAPPLDAARAGVYIHGLAGDLAAEAGHPRAMTARDIVSHIGRAFALIDKTPA